MAKSLCELFFEKYEYLAHKYSSKIFSYEELGLEYDDLLQEFRLKLLTSIRAYARRWSQYRETGRNKPVPIKFYLEAACGNKARDFMKLISRVSCNTRIDDVCFDYGIEQDTCIDPSANKFIVNGIDLLEGLSGKERIVFSLHLRGYNKNFLNKVYYNNKREKQLKNEIVDMNDEPITPQDIIDMQRQYLVSKYGGELLKARKVYRTYSFDD